VLNQIDIYPAALDDLNGINLAERSLKEFPCTNIICITGSVIGMRIQKCREECGMKRNGFADALGVSIDDLLREVSH
jgi:DNA-binding transcriptional regulator YiaG